jgi:two-component sensor histidine kinase
VLNLEIVVELVIFEVSVHPMTRPRMNCGLVVVSLLKRDLCLWLEEALCNVGKHAQGATRLVVTGHHHENQYVLHFQDNGIGLNPALEQQGTKFCIQLAQRLGGTFQRISLPKGGVLCELSWRE